MTKEKKKSKLGRHLISISFFTVMGVILGFAMIAFLEWQIPEGIPSSERATFHGVIHTGSIEQGCGFAHQVFTGFDRCRRNGI